MKMLLACACVLLVAGCTGDSATTPNDKLVGDWTSGRAQLTLFPNGKGKLTTDGMYMWIKWRDQSSNIFLGTTDEGITQGELYAYKLEGNKLTISPAFLGVSVWKRRDVK